MDIYLGLATNLLWNTFNQTLITQRNFKLCGVTDSFEPPDVVSTTVNRYLSAIWTIQSVKLQLNHHGWSPLTYPIIIYDL